MAWTKYGVIFAVFVAFILLSGCIKVNIDHTIESNGDSKIDAEIDISAITSTIGGMGKETANIDAECDKFKKSTILKNPVCNVSEDNSKLAFGGEINLLDEKHMTKEQGFFKTTYKYNAKQIFGFLGEKTSTKTTEQQITQGFLKMNYTLTMPGKITQGSDFGDVTGNTITIDLAEIINLDKAIVISEETSFWTYALIVVLGLAILLGILLIVLKLKK